MAREQGQATVEWTGTVLLVAIVFAALAASVPAVGDGTLGESLLDRIVCAVRGTGCAQRAVTVTASTAAVARSAGVFDAHWVPGLNWKRTRARDAARRFARDLRDGGSIVAAIESFVGKGLPRSVIGAIALVAKLKINDMAGRVDAAADRAGPQGVCTHYGVKGYVPALPGRTLDFDITAWPVGKGGPC